MSHEIEKGTTGKGELVYVGAVPWHTLGWQCEAGATGQDMKIKAGLNWQIELRELAFMLPGATGDMVNPLSHYRAVTRSDNDRVFGVVTKWWNPVQNDQIVDFFQAYCEAGHATMEAVGALKGGAVVWALAKLGAEASKKLLGVDVVEGYVLMATSHDQSMVTTARGTQVRAICANTIGAAMRDHVGSQNIVRTSHTKKWTKDVEAQAQKQLGIMIEDLAYTNELAEKLAKVHIDDDGRLEFVEQLLLKQGTVLDAVVEAQQPAGSVLDQIIAKTDKPLSREDRLGRIGKAILHAIVESPGADLLTAKGTLWGAVNGATWYADHERGTSEDTRLRAAWFGDGSELKNDALSVAAEMAGVN
jgi:phage/plasmid-like protein (TIGR03299 family)